MKKGIKGNPQVGDKVRILNDVDMPLKNFKKGHEFRIYGRSFRGFDLIDDNGNKLDETLMIQDELELIEDDGVSNIEIENYIQPLFVGLKGLYVEKHPRMENFVVLTFRNNQMTVDKDNLKRALENAK